MGAFLKSLSILFLLCACQQTVFTGQSAIEESSQNNNDTTPHSADTTLSRVYKNDHGIASDPRVVFHSDFENGLAGWSSYSSVPVNNEALIRVVSDVNRANGGSQFLQARVTRTQLGIQEHISANAQARLSRAVPVAYWRFYAKIVGQTAHPHHWVRVGAGSWSDGWANNKPIGDQGFWYDLDISNDNALAYYVYWYQMHSGRCNDGSVTPGCAGDQGTTYYYGNNFKPANQTPLSRDQWICIETMTKANTIGQNDGELKLWVNDQVIGEYKTGTPLGRWLRDSFYTFGQYFDFNLARPFEGFNFRSSNTVNIQRVTLDAYYERGSLNSYAPSAPEEQIIQYDDIVVASERIGCKVP